MSVSEFNAYLRAGEGNPLAKPSGNRQALIRTMYTRILIELCANRFRWTGLPPEIDVRFMELTLIQNGLSVFYWEKEYDKFMARQGSPSGKRNNMDEPVAFTMPKRTPSSGMATHIRKGQCVPIWPNYLQISELDVITIFSQRLAESDVTLEVNRKNARRPRILVANKDQRHSLQAINNQIDEGVAAIGVNRSFDPEQITSIDLGINPDILEKLNVDRGRIWNHCMMLLGIENANQDKKERMVVDEVSANDEQVGAMKAVSLNARRRAAAEINALYDGSEANALVTGYRGPALNVSVDFTTDPQESFADMLAPFVEENDEGNDEEGENNGGVY